MDKGQRFDELDSLRGLAAISVLLFHSIFIFPHTQISNIILEYTPFRLLVAGSEAVILFFVLSGFVLSLNFYKNKQFSYTSYITKRFFRIYPAYYFVIFIGAICCVLTFKDNINSLSDWYNVLWTGKLNSTAIIDHVLLVKSFLSNINPVTWSLIHEMRISIIFPLIIFLMVKMNLRQVTLYSLLFVAISITLFIITDVGDSGVSYINTLHYIPTFIVGALVAKNYSSIVTWISNLNSQKKVAIFSFGLFSYLFAKPSFFIANFVYPNIRPYYKTIMDEVFVVFGSVVIIVMTLTSKRIKRVLYNNSIKFLGKISYSLYLSHIVILIAVIQLTQGMLHPIVTCLIVLIGSIAASSLIYFFIEKPFIRLGVKLSIKMNSWRVVSKDTVTKTKAAS